jgi:predicted RND superfamily exporter protein
MISRFLQFWAKVVYRYYLVVLALALILTVACFSFLSRIEFRTDVMALLPPDLPAVRHLLEARDDFGADLALMVVTRTDGGQVIDYTDVVEDLAERIAESELVAGVDYNLLADLPYDAILRHLPALMEPGDLERLARRLSDHAIADQVAKDRLALISIPAPMVQELIRRDPLDLFSLIRGRFTSWGGSEKLATTDGYFINGDGNCLLALVRPTQSSDDVDYDEALMAMLNTARDRMLAEYVDEDELEPGLLQIQFTGPHIIAAIESNLIRREMLQAVLLSLLGVLVLFAVAFKRIGSFLYIGLPLVAAGFWTMGFCYLYTGAITLLGGAVLAIMIGLGVDFAIHIFSRFLDYRGDGKDPLEALSIAMGETGRSVFTGAVTTAMAFYAMSFYDFKGIREFGVITGTGVLLCMISMFTVLPAMLTFRAKIVKRYHHKKLFTFGTEHLARTVQRHYRLVLVLFALMTLFLGWQALNLEVEEGFAATRAEINPAYRLMGEVQQAFGISFQPIILTLEGEDLARVEAMAAEADRQLEPLTGRGLLRSFDSIFSYLPRRDIQEVNVAGALALCARLDPERVERVFLEELEAGDFDTAMFSQYAATVRAALEDPRVLTVNQILRAESLYRYFFRYMAFKGDGSIRLAYYLYPAHRPAGEELLGELERMTGQLSGLGGKAHVSGIPILTDELKRLTRSGYRVVSLLALGLVVLVLSIHFRRPGRVALVLAPLVLAVIWLTGIMALFDVQLNIMNVAVTPMILGIGIDYAVYTMHLYFQNPGTSLPLVFRTGGKALVLSTITTTVGFGSLVLARHPGLSTMGLLATVGVCLCLLATICFLPAAITLRERILER